jgi:hypothetical protein
MTTKGAPSNEWTARQPIRVSPEPLVAVAEKFEEAEGDVQAGRAGRRQALPIFVAVAETLATDPEDERVVDAAVAERTALLGRRSLARLR